MVQGSVFAACQGVLLYTELKFGTSNSIFEQEFHVTDDTLQNKILLKKILLIINMNPKLQVIKSKIRFIIVLLFT